MNDDTIVIIYIYIQYSYMSSKEKALLLDLVKVVAPIGLKAATGTISPTNVKTALTELARIYPDAHKQAVARLRQHGTTGGTGKKKKKKKSTKRTQNRNKSGKKNKNKIKTMTSEEDPVRLENIYKAARMLHYRIKDHVRYPDGRTKNRIGASFSRLMRHYNSKKKNQTHTHTNKKTRSAQIAQDKLVAEMDIVHNKAMSLHLEKQVRASQKQRNYENVYNKDMQTFSATLAQVIGRMQGYNIRLRNKTLPHQKSRKKTRTKKRN